MKTHRSLRTSPQLRTRVSWKYKATAAILAIFVAIGTFVFFNLGNNSNSQAGVTAEETGISSYDFTSGTNGVLENMGSGTTTLIGSNRSGVSSDVTPIGFNFVFMGKMYNSFSVNP